MAYNRLGSKTEEAAALLAAVQTYAATPAIYKGRDNADKVAPCVIFRASVGEESPMGMGNYYVELFAIVKSIAADGEAAHNALAAEVSDMLSDSALAASLSSQVVTGFHCFGAMEMNGSEPEVEGDCLVESVSRRLYCCASDIAAS